MKFISKILVLTLFHRLVVANAVCPTNKESRKRQEQKLRSLNDQDIIAVLKLVFRKNNKYRFMVETVWHKQNGSLKQGHLVTIDGATSKYSDCLGAIKKSKSYIMVLSKEKNTYRQIEPPVPSEREKHRGLIFKQLCLKLDDEKTCQIKVSVLRTSSSYYNGQHILVECKVDTTEPITEIRWFKDNRNIENAVYTSKGVSVEREGTMSVLFIESVDKMHEGYYECRVKTNNSQMGRAKTLIEVHGVEMQTNTECQIPSKCFNGGTCYRHPESNIERCECPTNYSGSRCEIHDTDIERVAMSHEEKVEDMEKTIRQLTMGILAAAALLIGVMLVVSIYIVKLRRKVKKGSYKHRNKPFTHREEYQVVVQSCCDEEMPIHSSTENGKKETSAILLQEDVPVNLQSRQTSEARPPSSVNGQQFSIKNSKPDRLSPYSLNLESDQKNNLRSSSCLSTCSRSSSESDKSSKRGRLNAKSFS